MNERLEIIVLRAQVRALTETVTQIAVALDTSEDVGPLAKKRVWSALENLQYAGAQEQQDYERTQEP